jgi:hypothetical protein
MKKLATLSICIILTGLYASVALDKSAGVEGRSGLSAVVMDRLT